MPLPDLDAPTAALLDRYGFDSELFESLRQRLLRGEVGPETNRVQGVVEPPEEGDVRPLEASPQLVTRGEEALRAGQVGCVVLAGGMATRFGGVVKAGVEALPGHTFAALKLSQIRHVARELGARVPAYVMTSFATHDEVSRLIESYRDEHMPVLAFPQFISLRLTPEGGLLRDDEGHPSPYAPGHGDLSFALRRAGILERFRAEGGRTLYMSNVDNLAATLDAAVIGAHLHQGTSVTVEVVPKDNDQGGAPARVDGKLQVVEGFRFPPDFDQDRIGVFNTNSFVFDAAAIDRDFDLSWFAVSKRVAGREAVQFERLVGELTAFLSTGCLQVSRQGADSRFEPAKDPDELVRRQKTLREIFAARGGIS